MRVGIMGGTFDPIHIGHLLIAEAAWEDLKLDKVLFMPSGNPPHKQVREGATNSERLEITRLAIRGNPHFELSSFEMERAESCTYTYLTLENLHEIHPDWDQYFILGGDSLVDFHGWREPQRICDACTLAVAIRDHMPADAFDAEIRALKLRYHARVENSIPAISTSLQVSCAQESARGGASATSYLKPAPHLSRRTGFIAVDKAHLRPCISLSRFETVNPDLQSVRTYRLWLRRPMTSKK